MGLKKSLSRLFEAAALILLLVTIASCFTEENRYFELLSHFKNQYFYSALLLVAIFVVLKSIRGAALALVALLVSGIAVLPVYFQEPKSYSPVASSAQIKVMLSNVLSSNTQYQKLIDYILQESPDILVLQELDHNWISNLSPVIQRYPTNIIIPRNDNFGIAVLSKLQPVDQQITYWGDLDIPSIEARLKINGHEFHVLATHPMPPTSAANYRFRNRQLADVAARASEIRSPKLLVGDLNITTWSSDYDQLEENTGFRNARYGFGTFPTWPQQIPFIKIPIDHILVSREFDVKTISTGPNIGSDHLPLTVVLRLHNEQPISPVNESQQEAFKALDRNLR